MGFQRDNVLTVDERTKSARKCLELLSSKDARPKFNWRKTDLDFFHREYGFAQSLRYAPNESTLQWLRDMVDRYVT